MPSYCDTTPEIDSIPALADMVMYKPYFNIATGCTSFNVHIKVPNECYFLHSNAPGYPADGSCGGSGLLHHIISMDKDPDCTNTTEQVLIQTLHYSEDPSGKKISIYVQNINHPDTAYENSVSKKRVHV